MSVALDAQFRSQRVRLANTVTAAAVAEWVRRYREREQALAKIVPVVEQGQGQVAVLTVGYLTAKARSEGQRVPARGLDPTRYTIERLRGKPAGEVYGRVFGALGGQLAEGAAFAVAFQSGRAALERLVRTDLQLAQTHTARDWMAAEERVVGYRRVLGPGNNCSLCRSASTRTYFKEDLMPIHENCGCSVAPLFGSRPVKSVGTKVRVVDDPEIGPRLLAEEWAA